MEDCLFCKIIDKQVKSTIVFEDDLKMGLNVKRKDLVFFQQKKFYGGLGE